MYSLLSVLLQREVGGDEGGEVKDELLSNASFHGLFFQLKKTPTTKKTLNCQYF